MSTDFKKVLVKDSRLLVTDQLAYAVKKGGQSVVSQTASAISASTSSVSFNVQIPSEQTIVDRKVFIKSTVTIDFNTFNPNNNQPAFVQLAYGQNVSLAAFPFHQCVSTIQATLNNNVTSINIRDVLPFLIRSNDSRDLCKINSSCPNLPDSLARTPDACGLYGAQLRIPAVQVTPNIPTLGQGGLPANTVTSATRFASMWPNTTNPTFGHFTNGGTDRDIIGNGAYAGYGSQSLLPSNNTPLDGPVQLYWRNTSSNEWNLQQSDALGFFSFSDTWRLVFTTIEPVLVQPFLWSNPVSNNQGLYGLQTIQLQYNLTDPARAFRCTTIVTGQDFASIRNLKIVSVSNCSLQFKYLTPHASDLLPARNVVPLLTYDRYFSNANNQPIQGNYQNKVQISSNTYNLTQVPDKICIFVRQKMANMSPNNNDVVPTIEGISLNWNNNAGLLSSATIHDLYQYSLMAGSNQSFNEYVGQAYGSVYANDGTPRSLGNSSIVPTVGSYLMLPFSEVVQLTEDYYSCGSLGNFQLQFNLTLSSFSTWGANSLEIVLVVVNSGIMVTDRGQTSTYTGILTKSDVMEASSGPALSSSDVKRIVGSGHLDSGRALPMAVCSALVDKGMKMAEPFVEKAKSEVSKLASRLM